MSLYCFSEEGTASPGLVELGIGESWEEQDIPEETHDAMEMAMSRRLAQVGDGEDFKRRILRHISTGFTDQLTPSFYGGFLVGFLDNPWSTGKDCCSTLLGIGTKVAEVAWLTSPLGMAWEFSFGDAYQGEIKAAVNTSRKVSAALGTAYDFAKEWGPEVCTFLGNLMDQSAGAVAMALRGEIPQRHKMGPELQVALEVITHLILMADDAWEGIGAYERGYWQGYIAFEVVAVVVAAILSAPAGGSGGAAVLARHVPKVTRILRYLEQLLSKFEDLPGIGKLVAKIRGFGDVAAEFGSFCFVAGTPVLTARGPRPIESIREGDWVWSRDDETSEWGWRPVARTFVTHPDTLVKVSYQAQEGMADEQARDGLGLVRQAVPVAGAASSITCTQGHLVHARRKTGGVPAAFVAAGSLQAGDLLTLADGRDAAVQEVRVEQAGPGTMFTTYNFTVAGHHTYFAGEVPVWVHNEGLSDCEKVLKAVVELVKAASGLPVKQKYFQSLVTVRWRLDPRLIDMAGKVIKQIDNKVWARAALRVSEIILRFSFSSDAEAYEATPTVEEWNMQVFGRPPTDGKTGEWIIQHNNDFKNIVEVGSAAKVHHPIPKRLLKYMNDNGFDIHVDRVAGVVLTQAEHDLIEAGLKRVIPHNKADIVGSPAQYLDDLEEFYRTHQHPKAKNMAKLVRGFKSKFL